MTISVCGPSTLLLPMRDLGLTPPPVGSNAAETADDAILSDRLSMSPLFLPDPGVNQESPNAFQPDLQAMAYAPVHPFQEFIEPYLLNNGNDLLDLQEDEFYKVHLGGLNPDSLQL